MSAVKDCFFLIDTEQMSRVSEIKMALEGLDELVSDGSLDQGDVTISRPRLSALFRCLANSIDLTLRPDAPARHIWLTADDQITQVKVA